ncbi:5'/3'-nucleotidase SurE [candidate division KSB1 bacterium]
MDKVNSKPTILLSNDDGINAPGLLALRDALRPLGECTVVAPEYETSGISHAVTMRSPVRIRNNDEFGWAVAGTPADCIKFAVENLFEEPPALLVSGINQGSNTAVNAMYSGTVAAAAEGGIMNIPSIAISIAEYGYDNFTLSVDFARVIAMKVLKDGLPDYTFLNINIPAVRKEKLAGIRFTHMGRTRYKEFFEERFDPSNRPYYWLKGEKILLENSDESDEVAVNRNFIAVTPLTCDLTDYQALDSIKKWDLSL